MINYAMISYAKPYFQSNAPSTCTLSTFWGLGITPKPPRGHHASFGTTQ